MLSVKETNNEWLYSFKISKLKALVEFSAPNFRIRECAPIRFYVYFCERTEPSVYPAGRGSKGAFVTVCVSRLPQAPVGTFVRTRRHERTDASVRRCGHVRTKLPTCGRRKTDAPGRGKGQSLYSFFSNGIRTPPPLLPPAEADTTPLRLNNRDTACTTAGCGRRKAGRAACTI